MENPRHVTRLVFALSGVVLFSVPLFSRAYDARNTHPGLTEEILRFYNRSFADRRIGEDEMRAAIKGSVEEDNDARWTHHFYDPVHNKGLEYAGTTWQSSKEWAQDTRSQAVYGIAGIGQKTLYGTIKDLFSSNTDYSWDRAVYEYAWGDRERAMEALGHALHLLEDVGVPDHTRNDPHPGIGSMISGIAPEFLVSAFEANHGTNASPYESFARNLNEGSLKLASALKKDEIPPFNSFNEYFDDLAKYSNSNFFSRDTIFSEEYIFPRIFEERIEKLDSGIFYKFGYGKDTKGNLVKLVKIEENFGDSKENYTIKDPDNLILTDYWNHLSRQIILHGAGAVKTFFDEAEKEKKDKALYAKNRSWLTKRVADAKAGIFRLASILYGSSVTQADLEDGGMIPDPPPASVEPPPAAAQKKEAPPRPPSKTQAPPVLPLANAPAPLRENEKKPAPPPTPAVPAPNAKPAQNEFISWSSGSGGGGVSRAEEPKQETADDSAAEPPAAPASPSAAPDPPALPDLSAPAVSVSECAQSLSSSQCLIIGSSAHLSWSSALANLDHYEASCAVDGSPCPGFALPSPAATSAVYSLPRADAAYTFRILAVDASGQRTGEAIKEVAQASRPVVINEIAWAGTSASRSADEWIELYNTTDADIALSDWVLRSKTDDTPYIPLSGTIPAKGFFLLERTDDAAIADRAADQTYTGALDDGGEALELSRASTTIDATPDAPACGGWCGGAAGGAYSTMERFDPYGDGTSPQRWATWAGFLPQGHTADNEPVQGTPRHRNAVNFMIDRSGTSLSASKTLKKAHSPYIVPNTLDVPPGTTLAIEPGVVIKLMEGAGFTVRGALIAEGTSAEPVVFTSYYDDAYAGDTNEDAEHASAAPGNWTSIAILADGSSFDHAVVRYGGSGGLCTYCANIYAANASLAIRNSVIERSGMYGAWYKDASGTVDSAVFRDNDTAADARGLLAERSRMEIEDSTFANSRTGILILLESSAPGTTRISNNAFTGNSDVAADVMDAYPSFSGNAASGNGYDGIRIIARLDRDYALPAGLPYLVAGGDLTVPQGRTLMIQPGTALKFDAGRSLIVDGTLDAEGSAASPIVFTASGDADCGIGGCAAVSGAAPPQPGDWSGILFSSHSTSSILAHAIVRYGGPASASRTSSGAVRIIGSGVRIADSLVENGYEAGIWIEDSPDSEISGSVVQDHDPGFGVFVKGSSSNPLISGTLFRRNGTHIYADEAAYRDGGGNGGE